MKAINPCLWFNTEAEEAMNFYTSIFPNSKKGKLTYYGDGMHMKKGTVLTATFSLNGNEFMALNGGPNDAHSHAISLMALCDTQAEIDHLWDKLGEGGGGTYEQCGWLRDKYGVAWQICPSRLREWMEGGDAAQTQRLMDAVMKMVKLDIATMEKAAKGELAA